MEDIAVDGMYICLLHARFQDRKVQQKEKNPDTRFYAAKANLFKFTDRSLKRTAKG